MKLKSKLGRIPNTVYDRVAKLGNNLNETTTEAFRIQEKVLFGDFKLIKKKNVGKKKVFELEFD